MTNKDSTNLDPDDLNGEALYKHYSEYLRSAHLNILFGLLLIPPVLGGLSMTCMLLLSSPVNLWAGGFFLAMGLILSILVLLIYKKQSSQPLTLIKGTATEYRKSGPIHQCVVHAQKTFALSSSGILLTNTPLQSIRTTILPADLHADPGSEPQWFVLMPDSSMIGRITNGKQLG